MPPKPKFTREEIVSTALEVVSQKGIDSLTAKELSLALGSSARPIFTVFSSMKELQQAVRAEAMLRFESYTEKTMPSMPQFKQAGMKMVLFGLQEPKLYQFLFMQENPAVSSFEDLYLELGTDAGHCIEMIEQDYGLSTNAAKQLFEMMWIYTFGIGTLCATGVCKFTPEQLSTMLTDEFQAVMTMLQH